MMQPLVLNTSPRWLLVGVPQVSVAVTTLRSTAGISPKHWTAMFAGPVMIGRTVSCTVTVKLHEFVTPNGSVAKQTTVFVPTEKNAPEGGWHTTTTFEPHKS